MSIPSNSHQNHGSMLKFTQKIFSEIIFFIHFNFSLICVRDTIANSRSTWKRWYLISESWPKPTLGSRYGKTFNTTQNHPLWGVFWHKKVEKIFRVTWFGIHGNEEVWWRGHMTLWNSSLQGTRMVSKGTRMVSNMIKLSNRKWRFLKKKLG
jgi:hypothetical protein